MPRKINLSIATQIKEDLWQGHPQRIIANKYNVEQATISRIHNGRQWPQAPWPNQARGPMPYERTIQLSRQRAAPQAAGSFIEEIASSTPGFNLDRFRRLVSTNINQLIDEEEKEFLQQLEINTKADKTEVLEDQVEWITQEQWDAFKEITKHDLVDEADKASLRVKTAVYYVLTQDTIRTDDADLLTRLVGDTLKKVKRRA
jgi:hypothetical protein